jgi:hypothetical protein
MVTEAVLIKVFGVSANNAEVYMQRMLYTDRPGRAGKMTIPRRKCPEMNIWRLK